MQESTHTSTVESKESKKAILEKNSQKEALLSPSSALLKMVPTLEKSPLFETKNLQKGEILFQEGTLDNKLYIIKSGILSVDKYTTNEKTTTKQLALLKAGDFLGENGLHTEQKPKEANIRCIENAQLLHIDLRQDLKKFLEENPSVGFELMRFIITETNNRLNEVNKLFTANYELEKTINNLKSVDMKGIFLVLERMQAILDVDYILYFERHQVLENFLTLRYDSRFPGKMLDKIFEKKGNFLDLTELYQEANISQDDHVIVNKIGIGDEIYGYLILGREKRSFDGSDKKVLSSASNSLAGVVKKYLGDKDEKNKLYISEMKKH